jgi:glycosyltransferase involved in cell wall biosynthesis
MMRRCRVLYVATTARGGSALSLYCLVSRLDRSRYEPAVLFYVQEHPHIGDELADLGIRTPTLQKWCNGAVPALARSLKRRDIAGWLDARFGRRVGRAYLFLKACYQFMRRDVPKIRPILSAIREHEADLVHINTGLRHGKPGIIASWLARTPCICHVRMLDELGHFDKIFARFVDSFIYISGAVTEHYTAQGIRSVRGTVVHNAIDLSEYTTDLDGTAVRSEFGWNGQERVVGVIGRLDWWKGHEYFLQAMAEAVQEIPNLKGLIVGEPEATRANQEYYRKLRALTESLGLEDRIIFTGFRSDVPRILAALDVVVLSSSTPEPFGRVVIEGMAAGKPVVATAAGGVLEIITDGLDGLLVPCKDSKAMARAIVSLLRNPGWAEQIGTAARQRVAQAFSVERHVAQVQGVYDSILGCRQIDPAAPEGHRR